MTLLTRQQFMERKKHDRIAIMGSGYSINDITEAEWTAIHNDCDSLGFNWFCNAGRDTTFYLIREQCVSVSRLAPGSESADLIQRLSGLKTTLVVKDKYRRGDDIYSHLDHLNEFSHEGIVVPDKKAKHLAMDFDGDMFVSGLVHRNTMYDCMHFAKFMAYKEIVFFGVDLYDLRYFWLGPEETRDLCLRKNQHYTNRHGTAGPTMDLIQYFHKAYPGVVMSVHNPKSLLASIIPVWKCP